MRRIYIASACILSALLIKPAFAAKYYVSPQGSDAAFGTLTRPFRTISKATSLMKPGDTCIVNGGVYRETVRPSSSGTFKKPLRFVAQDGESVIISGSEPVSGWIRYKGNMYKAKIDIKLSQLYVDGRMMNQARWPNTGFDLLHPHLGALS